MEDGAAKVAALRAKRDAWMSQRSAAMERENMRSEDGGLVALGGGAGDGGAVNDDLVLDRITEQITSRLREELRIEVQREEQVASRQRAKEGEEIGGYLASELESTTCPICYELMQAPQHTPTLLFPCGHTFCIECVTAHIKANHRHTCPYCRVKIEKQAPNMLLQQLIDGFAQKKASTTQKAAAAAARPPAAVAQMALAVERPDVGRILADCPGEARGQIEDYIRQWRALQMRWRIYDNEAADCKRDEANIRAKREASGLVRKHLHTELADSKHRVELALQEVQLIEDQIEMQKDKDVQMDSDVAERRRRQQLIATTLDALALERSKVRLMVEHFVPPGTDINAVLPED